MKQQEINDLVESWVRPEIKAISAYHVPDATGLIKLDAMENPYVWPDEIREGWLDLLREVDVNRYPDPQARAVTERLIETMEVPQGARLLLGNGSDELIQMLAMTLGGPGRSILSVDPSFVMYDMIARFVGSEYIGVPLRSDDFGLDSPAILRAMEQHRPALVFLAYPNNPSGNLFSAQEMERIIEAAPGLVIVDEAYAPFTDASFMSRLNDYPNLLVMRTLSKMGLAGLRLGLLAGAPEWIDQIDKTRLPYNINVLTQASAEFALRHKDVFDGQTAEIREQRSVLFDALQAIDGVRPFPSEANFILVKMPVGRAGQIHTALRDAGILVKNLDGGHPALQDCLRITVGTPEENGEFMEEFTKIL